MSSINRDESSPSQHSPVPREGPTESGNGAEETSGRSKTADGMSAHLDWRELARRIEIEKDPRKVIELAQQLIEVIDAKRLGKSVRQEGRPDATQS